MDRELSMLVPVLIDPILFVQQLSFNATYEEILDILIALDEEMADSVFTEMVYDYFSKRHMLDLEEMD
jgi:hypothetical protein